MFEFWWKKLFLRRPFEKWKGGQLHIEPRAFWMHEITCHWIDGAVNITTSFMNMLKLNGIYTTKKNNVKKIYCKNLRTAFDSVCVNLTLVHANRVAHIVNICVCLTH